MTVKRITSEETALRRTLDRVNLEIGLTQQGSQRLARLNIEKTAVKNKLGQHRQGRPDR